MELNLLGEMLTGETVVCIPLDCCWVFIYKVCGMKRYLLNAAFILS